jgi:Protein of unknown function (DUF2796)
VIVLLETTPFCDTIRDTVNDMKRPAITLLAAALAAAPAVPGEQRRELGRHVHGHGTLNIAIEDKRVTMELEAPGMDIVGFEHSAESKEQKTAVKKANALLAQPLSLFKPPKSAGCVVAAAKVAIGAKPGGGDEHRDAQAKADGGEHAQEGHGGHNEFHATYALVCDKPVNLTSLEFDYFKLFPGAQELTVNVVTGKTQNQLEVSRENPSLDLAGMM